MNARLTSWLVAGSVALTGGQLGSLQGRPPVPELAGRPSVASASLETDGDSARVRIGIPGFSGRPAVQVLRSPDRISPDRLVVDFHGVDRGRVPKSEITSLAHPLILRARLAQFASDPESITRLVLELAPGAKAVVSYGAEGAEISLAQGTGRVQALLSENFIRHAKTPAMAQVAGAAPPPVYSPRRADDGAPARPEMAGASADALDPADQGGEQGGAEQLPQVGSPYVGLPSLGSIPVAPLAAAHVQQTSALAPKYPTQKAVKSIGDPEAGFHGERISLDVQNADLRTICLVLAQAGGMNLVMDPEVQSGGWVYHFDDTPWDKVLDIVVKNAGLGKEVSDGIIRIAKSEKIRREEEDRKALQEARALAGDLITVTRALSYAKVDDAQKIVSNLKSDRGRIFTDARTNMMILTDLPRYVDAMQQLLDLLDVKVPQVQIDARIVEANRGWEKAIGVSWPHTGSAADNGMPWNSVSNKLGDGGNRIDAAFTPGRQGVTDIPAPAGELWVSFLTNRVSLSTIIQALEKNSQIKVVSEPKLTVQNNQVGLIDAGARVPYQSNQSGVAGGAITVQFVEAKLKLEVTPQITNEGTVLLDVSIANEHPDFAQQVNGTPTIQSKNIKTTVRVEDGGTIILGGVFTNTVDSGTTGVPFLSKLPGLGWLFRSKTINDKTTVLLVMISPKIINYWLPPLAAARGRYLCSGSVLTSRLQPLQMIV
jgi:type IV pilus assembly protein PilQ